MNTKVQTLTMKELEELGEKLSAWAESDEFFEALETATVLPRNAETIARSNEILKAAGRGRPTLAPASKGDSPTINARVTPNIKERLTRYAKEQGMKPSDVIRDALDSYLPQAS